MDFDDLAASAPDNPARLEQVERRASGLRRRRALVSSGAGTAVLAVAAVGVFALLPGGGSHATTQLVPAASTVPSPAAAPVPTPVPSPVPGAGLQTVPAPVPAPSLPAVAPCVYGIKGPVYVAATPAPRYVMPCPDAAPAGTAVPRTAPSPVAPVPSGVPARVTPVPMQSTGPVPATTPAPAGSSYTG